MLFQRGPSKTSALPRAPTPAKWRFCRHRSSRPATSGDWCSRQVRASRKPWVVHWATQSLLRSSPGWPFLATRVTHALRPQSPVERVRSTHGRCGQNLRRDVILHRCKPGFAIPCCPARRMRRCPCFARPRKQV